MINSLERQSNRNRKRERQEEGEIVLVAVYPNKYLQHSGLAGVTRGSPTEVVGTQVLEPPSAGFFDAVAQH